MIDSEVLDFVNTLADEPVITSKSEEKHVIVQFVDSEGHNKGDPISLPASTSQNDLENILKSNIEQENPEFTNYEFYVDGIQVLDDLDVAVKQYRAKLFGEDQKKAIESTENIVNLTYQAQALFHVRPVTRCSSSIPGHKGAVLFAQFSPDGKTLATGSGDATVRFYDLNTELPCNLGTDCHSDPVLCICWAPDGLTLASGCQGGKIGIWTLCTRQDVEADQASASSSDSSAPKKMLGEMFLKSTLVKTYTPGKKWIRSIAFRPYHIEPLCRHLAACYQDNTIVIWDTFQGHQVRVLSGHGKPVTAIRWGGSDLIYSASQDQTIRVWNWDTGSMVRSLSLHGHWINCIAVSTDYVLRTGPFDPAKASLVHTNPHVTGNLRTVEAREELRLFAQKLYEKFKGPEGERVAVGSDDNTLSLWRPAESGKPICDRMTGHQGVVNDVKFSPDGRLIASASFDHSVKIWEGRTGKFLATMYGHVSEVYLVAWSADSRLLVSGSKDSTVKLWTMKEVRRWTQDQLVGGQEAKLLANGTKFKRLPLEPIVTADNAVPKKKQRPSTGRGPFQGKRHLLHDLPGHADAVFALDWSPDGQRVVSGSKDRMVKMSVSPDPSRQ
ncbi:hypothetical protein Ciccas_009170 [Cichlidogyrus casuarinus]|uniref:NLE domain-containing protein n=1 Tax=Cichlidogyrus casuarinus TaxID=1844966 RepID=A0ABD2PXV3_9PLAT